MSGLNGIRSLTLLLVLLLVVPGVSLAATGDGGHDTFPLRFDGLPLRYERVLQYKHPYPDRNGFYVNDIGEGEGPAVKAGLRLGHTVVAVNDRPVETYRGIQEIVNANLGETVTFTVLRKTPKFEKELRENPFYKPRGGALYEQILLEIPYPVPEPRRLTVVRGDGDRLYHRLNLHHSPDTRTHTVYQYPQEARDRGLKPCPICFAEEESHFQKLLQQRERDSARLRERLRGEFGVDTDPPEYLDRLLDRMRPGLIQEHPTVETVVLKTKRIYGFGLRDGTLLLSQGLLDVLETESEGAAVLAHLLAHYDRRHEHSPVHSRQFRSLFERAIKQATGFDFDFSQLREWSSTLPGFSYYRDLIEEGYSEPQEREAVFLSMVYLYRAGYPYHGLRTWFEKHRDMVDQVHPRWIDYLLIHPLPGTLQEDFTAWKRRIPKNFKRRRPAGSTR